MNLKIEPDQTFRGIYLLSNDKRCIAVIHQTGLAEREISFTVTRLNFTQLKEVHEFVTSYDKWLTEEEWLT